MHRRIVGRRMRPHRRFHGLPELTQIQQETLEQIFRVCEREGIADSSLVKEKMDIPSLGQVLSDLEEMKLINRAKGKINFSEKGEEEASKLIRKNRLAEVLFTQVFEMRKELAQEIACKFEHIALSDDVTDSICTFLGHPPTSPDGRPIPPGACCREGRKDLTPIVKRLSELNVGDEGRVVFMRPTSHSFLDNLSSIGIVPGVRIRIHQKYPSLILLFNNTTIAMDEAIGKDIFVRVRFNED